MGVAIDLRVDVSDLAERGARARRALSADLRAATLDAARAGIEAAQHDHPYTDRTGVLSGYRGTDDTEYRGGASLPTHTSGVQITEGLAPGEQGADMVWPAFYASFVDRGTSRSAPYPFTPQAKKAAQERLDQHSAHAIQRFVRALSR